MRGEQALQLFVEKTKPFFKKHGTTILTGVGAAGVVATAVSAAKATPKAMRLLEQAKEEKGEELTKTEKFKVAAPAYIPTAIIGASTIACIVGSHILDKRKQAALISAYTLLDSSYKEYQEKVKETFGEEAEEKIKHEIAKEKYDENPLNKEFEETNIFFYEHRNDFFELELEDVQEAEYQLNRMFALRGHVSLNDFYDLLNLPRTPAGDVLGWSIYAGESAYGYQWIDFFHVKDTMDDGTVFYRIDTPYGPTADYMDY